MTTEVDEDVVKEPDTIATTAANAPEKKKDAEPLEKVESSSPVVPKKVGPVAYRMKPTLEDSFRTKSIRLIIQSTLSKTLQGKKYNQEDGRKWTREIADSVSFSVKDLNMARYKHVVTVTLGQQQGSGCRYITKCSWDADCDSYASDVFSNATMFCVCTVFGIYLY